MLCVVGVCVAPSASADVFQFIAEDGTSHFSDQPTDARFKLLLRTSGDALLRSTAKPGFPVRRVEKLRFEEAISLAAQSSRIETALLHAVIEVESGYNPNAISPKGAMGLMQLMPATARRYGLTDPMNVRQNLQGGAHLLRDLLDQFSENKELALAAYNAGAGAVLAHGRRVPPFPETTRYVPAVLKIYALQRGSIQ